MPNGLTFFSSLLLLFASQSKAACPVNAWVPSTNSQRTYVGEYKNLSYGYSVVIPHGLTGVDMDNPAYQRGFTIILRDPSRTISVSAETNSLEYNDSKAAAVAELYLFKQQGLQVAHEHTGPTELAGHAAANLSFRFACSGAEAEYLHIEILALSPDGQYVYTISWDGPSNMERLDQRLIAALRRSWRMFPAK